jgi:hypothetical protein
MLKKTETASLRSQWQCPARYTGSSRGAPRQARYELRDVAIFFPYRDTRQD